MEIVGAHLVKRWSHCQYLQNAVCPWPVFAIRFDCKIPFQGESPENCNPVEAKRMECRRFCNPFDCNFPSHEKLSLATKHSIWHLAWNVWEFCNQSDCKNGVPKQTSPFCVCLRRAIFVVRDARWPSVDLMKLSIDNIANKYAKQSQRIVKKRKLGGLVGAVAILRIMDAETPTIYNAWSLYLWWGLRFWGSERFIFEGRFRNDNMASFIFFPTMRSLLAWPCTIEVKMAATINCFTF